MEPKDVLILSYLLIIIITKNSIRREDLMLAIKKGLDFFNRATFIFVRE